MSDTQAIDWEGRYRDGATGWERPGLHPAFLEWRNAGILKPGRVLIPGAGRSNEPLALAEAGFEVTVVDGAPSAVAVQRARLERLNVGASVNLADLFQWEPASRFDYIYDQTCLCALPPASWPEYADRLHRWLRPGGTLLILFMQTGSQGGPPFHCDLPAMRRLFGESRWEWPERLGEAIVHPSARMEQPVALRAI